MVRQTLLDAAAPFTAFAQSVDAGVALASAWHKRNDNEAVVMDRMRRVLEALNDGKFSDAATRSKRVIAATSLAMNDIELLAYIDTVSASVTKSAVPARDALRTLRSVASKMQGVSSLPSMPQMAQVAGLSDDQLAGMVRAMSQLGTTDSLAVERSLRLQIQARVRAYHAYVILSTARRRGSAFPAVTATVADIGSRARELRDEARAAARKAVDADAIWFIGLASAVARYEKNWESEVGDPCIALLVAGAKSNATLAERRSAALAYDAMRMGLTWLAGTYSLLLDWARADASGLREWAARGALPLESGFLDLPRADVAVVAAGGVQAGSDVEVAGVVTASESEVQAGRVRTILRLDDLLTVYFPFSAVDGFGILPGVWCQVRGTVLNESKGGFPAPTVSVRRRKLGDAAERGFSEYLEFQARTMFDRMRAGNDATAGRLAHDARTANEAGDWM